MGTISWSDLVWLVAFGKEHQFCFRRKPDFWKRGFLGNPVFKTLSLAWFGVIGASIHLRQIGWVGDTKAVPDLSSS
ncbi:hypothetical protein TNCT_73871 [Trichonephila clavata]|uniref:Uncharacterized protein n=1 Tax=Trichonephila clavata TaxID=2740835 RepID=A0A8X6GME4_TRICU|nr:hypothetical protein TNCT_73871 [Trichonephila clavata]